MVHCTTMLMTTSIQSNPYNFPGKKTYTKEPVFNIESANISCDEVVKLPGIDY